MSTRDEFTQGESFGRHVARQELLPLLKAVRSVLRDERWLIRSVEAVIADIEPPPVTPTPTTPTDDESIPF